MKEKGATQTQHELEPTDTWTSLGTASAHLLEQFHANSSGSAAATAEPVSKLNPGELAIETASCVGVCSGSVLGRIEVPEVKILPVFTDTGAPSLSVTAAANAFEAGCVSPALGAVGLIQAESSFTKITQPIIGAIAVDVINHVPGPASINMKPDQVMGTVGGAIDGDRDVGPLRVSCDASAAGAARKADFPTESTGFGAVIEQSSDFIDCQHLAAHQNQNEEAGEDHDPDYGDEQKLRDRERYVDQRLRELRTFERRAAGAGIRKGRR